MDFLLIHSLFSDIYFKSRNTVNKNTHFASLRTRAHTCSMTGQIPPNHRPCAGGQLNPRLQNSFRNVFQGRQMFKQRLENVITTDEMTYSASQHIPQTLAEPLGSIFKGLVCLLALPNDPQPRLPEPQSL